MTSNSATVLRDFVERIERLEDEIKAINDDKSDFYKEAKSAGFDVKTLRRVIQARRKDPADRAEDDMLFETYMTALEGGTEYAPARARTSPIMIEAQNPASPLDAGEAGGLVKASPEPSEPITEPVGRPSHGQPPTGAPVSPLVGGDPDLTIPDFLRRVK